MLIVGITGTIGAGKGTIVDYLVQKHNFKHYSVRNHLNNIIAERKLTPGRDSMVIVANDLRKKYGPSYLVEKLYKNAKKERTDTIIESIRTPGEIKALKNKGNFYLFAVDANPRKRYERVLKRASETDKISYQKFIDDERKEIESKDPNKQNLAKCILMADFKFDNNGSVEKLYDQVEKAIKKIQAS